MLGKFSRIRAEMIEAIDDRDLLALYEYWAGKRRGRTMPSRSDIDPAEILSLLPHLFIAEIHRPLRFRFRLAGTAICERWGENLTGKWLDELALDNERAAILKQYEIAAKTGMPRFDSEEFTNEHGRYLHYRRLLLPLSTDGNTPNMLLGAQKAIAVDGYQNPLPKWA
jgi:hypothetical protein